jgi:hypothetical protein
MARLTVLDLKNSRIPAALGLCLPSDNTRFLGWLNEAQERLLAYGRWWGSIVEAQFCTTEGCLVFPREVGTVEQIAICGYPVELANAWYEFTTNLAKIETCDGCCTAENGTAGMRGNAWPCGHLQVRNRAKQAASFAWTRGSNKVLRFYPTHSDDVGKTIVVQGYDSNNIWVRTNPGSGVIDGERVTLALPFVDTVTVWYPGSPSAIQKAVTSYRVLMYEYDTSSTLLRQLGDYQPSETNPLYRVAYVPGFSGITCGGCCDDDTNRRTITALVKLAHINLTADGDWVLFQNIAAYKEAMMAVRDWENGDIASGNIHFYGAAAPKQARMSNQATLRQGGAIPMLRAELRSMTGDSTTVFAHCENTDRLQWELGGYR